MVEVFHLEEVVLVAASYEMLLQLFHSIFLFPGFEVSLLSYDAV